MHHHVSLFEVYATLQLLVCFSNLFIRFSFVLIAYVKYLGLAFHIRSCRVTIFIVLDSGVRLIQEPIDELDRHGPEE